MTTQGQLETASNASNEPSMFVQRPSSSSCQDISHVLTKIFRDVFTKDAVDQEKVKNLVTSKSDKLGYHKRYVDNLEQVGIVDRYVV